ncbi:hypothetical protein JT358_00270 [Micrococcales bacterium 31B]|nr:hypothetical protein [Micrococcales bacterium 31B]
MSKTMRILGAAALTAALFGATATAAHASTTDAQGGTLHRVPCNTVGSVVVHSDLSTCWVGTGTLNVRLYNVDYIYTAGYRVSLSLNSRCISDGPRTWHWIPTSTVYAITLS